MWITRKQRLLINQIGPMVILIIFAIFAWAILHRTPSMDSKIHLYLTSISPELISQSYEDSIDSIDNKWAWTIAIRSTIHSEEARPIIEEFNKGLPLGTSLDKHMVKLLDSLPDDTKSTIQKRMDILVRYPYYKPGVFIFPFKDKVWYEDSYGASREGGKREHQGTDLFAPEGTPMYSVCDGIVEKLGWNRLGGERVGVRGIDENYYYYAHLQTIAPNLIVGQSIKKGTFIGTMGHTGDALTTPDHLHFGIQLPNEEWINPYPFLKAWQIYKDLIYTDAIYTGTIYTDAIYSDTFKKDTSLP